MFGMEFLRRKFGIQKDKVTTKKYVTALIQKKGGYPYFLLGLRKDTNKWSFIGGDVEDNETPIQAVVREIAEECGLVYTTSQVELAKEVITNNGMEISIYQTPQIEYDRILNPNNDPDGEFKQFRFFGLDELINCKIDLQYPCNDNVVIDYLKERYKDVKTDSITADSVKIPIKVKKKLTDKIFELVDKSKEAKIKEKRHLTDLVFELVDISKGVLSPNKAKFEENRQLLQELGLIGGENKSKENLSNIKKFVKKFMPEIEYKTMVSNKQNDDFVKIYNQIKSTPKMREQENKGDEAIVYLHYFKGGSDFYLTELDTETLQGFGIGALSGNYPEMTYIDVNELVENVFELDLYFTPTKLSVIKNKLNGIDEELPPQEPTTQTDPILDQANAILDKGKDITLNDLDYFTPDVVNYIDSEIDKGNEKAIELDTKLDNILKLFEIALDSVNLDNVNSNSVNRRKLSELLTELFLKRTAKNKSSEFKKEKALEEIQKLTETNLEVRNLIESIVENIEKRVEDEI